MILNQTCVVHVLFNFILYIFPIISKSGIQVGELGECSTALLTEFVKLASQEDAYGSVGTWGAAEVTELKYLIGKNNNDVFE